MWRKQESDSYSKSGEEGKDVLSFKKASEINPTCAHIISKHRRMHFLVCSSLSKRPSTVQRTSNISQARIQLPTVLHPVFILATHRPLPKLGNMFFKPQSTLTWGWITVIALLPHTT
ncbi:hypothetical protein AMTR_s00148p00091020 [Amborella trichopoda]|uniref:Uncharacterized protein n=1 Tax=Amborella trichopoda TaxID=13333 RepID=W1PKW6_AMBTC|nr:hypothetical protein AMTR_s00148p00091020 [Amborella trichopoda]